MNIFKSMVIAAACAMLMTACSSEQNVPVNQLFSEPGIYQSPNGKYLVEISQLPDNKIKYFMRDDDGNGQGPGAFSNKYELYLCWDDQSRVWSFHPQELVHYHFIDEERTRTVRLAPSSKSNSQIAGWSDMPTEFAKIIPENISDLYEKSVIDGTRHIPIAEKLLDELLGK